MSRYVPLALTTRPRIWEKFFYNGPVVSILKNILSTERLPNGIILSGIRGVGKTTAARLFARSLQCEKLGTDINPCNACKSCLENIHPDIIEVDGASHGNLEDIKKLLNLSVLSPILGKMKIFIIDEAHNLGRSQASWDALLKALEEPSSHIFWIFCTTQLHKIPDVIQSRLLTLELKSIPVSYLASYILYILSDIKPDLSSDASFQLGLVAQRIAELSDHSIRDGLTLVDKLVPYCDEVGWSLENALKLLGRDINDATVLSFVDHLINYNSAEIWKILQDLLDKGNDVEQIYAFISRTVEDLLSISLGVSVFMKDELLPRMQAFQPGRLNWIADKVLSRRDTISNGTNQEMVLKLLILEICT